MLIAQTASSNPLDRIEIEVGDSKQIDFFPQLKIMRWDNEVNVSIRLSDPLAIATSPVQVGNTITWTQAAYSCSWFPVSPSATLAEGGHEFNVVLPAKPPINSLTFTLVSKGVDFLFQPLLANVMPDGSSWEPRPDGMGRIQRDAGIGGGYALYYSAPPPNVDGGKLYRAGRVGFLHRPLVQDAVGTTTWADLNVNPIAGTLTVTIPQTFLDAAIYPVSHAAGLTFGYTTLGGTSDCDGVGGTYYFQLDALSPSGSNTDTNHSVGELSSCGIGTGKFALYNESAGAPSARQVIDGSTTALVDGWNTGPAVSFSLAASTQYWIGATATVTGHSARWDTGGTKTVSHEAGAALPATAAPDVTIATNVHASAYVTYTASGTAKASQALLGSVGGWWPA